MDGGTTYRPTAADLKENRTNRSSGSFNTDSKGVSPSQVGELPYAAEKFGWISSELTDEARRELAKAIDQQMEN